MSICPRCQSVFACTMADDDTHEPCWCMQLPPLPASDLDKPASSGAACLCPNCLRRLLVAKETRDKDH